MQKVFVTVGDSARHCRAMAPCRPPCCRAAGPPPPCRKWTWRPPSAALLPSSFPPAPSPLLPSRNPRVELLPPHPVDAPSGDTGHPEADRSRRRLRLAELQLPDAGISAGKPHIAVPTRSFPASGRHVGHRFVAVVPPRASPSSPSPSG